MSYIFLILTIISESAAVTYMKLSDGFRHKNYAAIAVITYILSFVFLTLALKRLPVGIANAIWAGASTLLVVLIGVWFFQERLSVWQLVFLGFIVIGLVGLNFTRSV